MPYSLDTIMHAVVPTTDLAGLIYSNRLFEFISVGKSEQSRVFSLFLFVVVLFCKVDVHF